MGAAVGIFWIYSAGTAMNLRTTLVPSWTRAMYLTCSVIRLIFLEWWLVPLANGIVYALIFPGVRTLFRLR
jgi:hypothetical protein